MKLLRRKRRKSLIRSTRYTISEGDIIFAVVLFMLVAVRYLAFLGA